MPSGRPVTGEVGELVITEPMPSMPLFLWGDEDGSRYRESYFEHYPGVWRHGDWIEITPRGTAVIYGRSDSTINRSGVRMGTSEIYRAVAALPEVGRRARRGPAAPGDGGLDAAVHRARRGRCAHARSWRARSSAASASAALRVTYPTRSSASTAVPRTLSGKVLEIPVKRILMGVPAERAASRGSLANPEALDYFGELATTLRDG